MGISGTLKTFEKISTKDKLSFLTFHQEALYIFRLYYPLYIYVGNKLQYHINIEQARFPLKIAKKYQPEVGVLHLT